MTSSKRAAGDWWLWGWALLAGMAAAIALAGLLIHLASFLWPDVVLEQFSSPIFPVAILGGIIASLQQWVLLYLRRGRPRNLTATPPAVSVPSMKMTWRDWLSTIGLLSFIVFMFVWFYLSLFGSDQILRDIAGLRFRTILIIVPYYSWAEQAWSQAQKLLKNSPSQLLTTNH